MTFYIIVGLISMSCLEMWYLKRMGLTFLQLIEMALRVMFHYEDPYGKAEIHWTQAAKAVYVFLYLSYPITIASIVANNLRK